MLKKFFIWSPMSALWKTSASHLYTSKISANIPGMLDCQIHDVRFSDLETLVDVFYSLCAYRGGAKLVACRCQNITLRTTVAAQKAQWDSFPHAPPPRKTFFSSYSAYLSNPIWLWKMLLNPPHFSPIPQFLVVLKCCSPWNPSQFLGPTSQHTKSL